jgi:hypothetical protein
VHSSGLLQQRTVHAAQLPNVNSCRTCTLLHTSGSDPAAALGGSTAFEWVKSTGWWITATSAIMTPWSRGRRRYLRLQFECWNCRWRRCPPCAQHGTKFLSGYPCIAWSLSPGRSPYAMVSVHAAQGCTITACHKGGVSRRGRGIVGGRPGTSRS